MDLDTLAKLGEFVGGIFVVVSMFYLAYQVRQNTKSLRIENYTRVLERMSTVQSRLAVDPELNRIVVLGAREPASLSRMERVRFTWALYELLGAGEFMFHQSRQQTLPPEVWKRWHETLRWWLSYPGIQAMWAVRPTPFASDFEAFVDDIIEHHPMSPAQIEPWLKFLAGDAEAASPVEINPNGPTL